jgi:hypothetical protein
MFYGEGTETVCDSGNGRHIHSAKQSSPGSTRGSDGNPIVPVRPYTVGNSKPLRRSRCSHLFCSAAFAPVNCHFCGSQFSFWLFQ